MLVSALHAQDHTHETEALLVNSDAVEDVQSQDWSYATIPRPLWSEGSCGRSHSETRETRVLKQMLSNCSY